MAWTLALKEHLKRMFTLVLAIFLMTGSLFAQAVSTEREEVQEPCAEYIDQLYHPESETENKSYNYSDQWDLDGDGEKDELLFIGNGGAHTYFFMSITLSSDGRKRNYPTIQLDMPYLKTLGDVTELQASIGLQFVVFDALRDGKREVYLNFDNSFSQIPEDWKSQGVTSKRVLLSFEGSEMKAVDHK